MRAPTIVLAAATAGCGLGVIDTNADGTGGLPTAGAGPYGRLAGDDLTPALEPQLIGERNFQLSDPTALRDDDGRLRIWFARAPDADPDASTIRYAEVPDERAVPDVGPMPVVAADQAWEEGRVAAPSVLADGAGLVMYYEGGVAAPAIGVARSTDGVTWEKDAAPVLAGAASPGATIVDGVTWLFVTRPGMAGIWRAVDTGAGFVLDAAPAVAPRPGLADAFDRAAVAHPFALAVPRRGGGTRIHLWFSGTTLDPMEDPAVGYAGSFDGYGWERFGVEKPMLSGFATGPTVLLEASRGLMLFTEPDRGSLAITVAEHP